MAVSLTGAALQLWKNATTGFYHSSVTASFNNPDLFEYLENGITLIRVYDAPTTGLYKGVIPQVMPGDGGSVHYEQMEPRYQFFNVLDMDFVKEMNSTTGRDQLKSVSLIAEKYLNKSLPESIDKTAIAAWFDSIPNDNRLSMADYRLDPAHIVDTILELERKVYDSGCGDEKRMLIRSDAMTSLRKAIADKTRYVENAIIEMKADVVNDAGISADDNEDSEIVATFTAYKFSESYLIPVPKDRMFQEILALDHQSTGQEAGGVVQDGIGTIALMALPKEAAVVSIRFNIVNMFVPAAEYDQNEAIEFMARNKKLFGNTNMQIQGVSINQQTLGWRFVFFTNADGAILPSRETSCFAVISASEADAKEVTASSTGNTYTVNVGTYTADELAVAATGVTVTNKAVANGVLTITYTAQATGTGKIEVYPVGTEKAYNLLGVAEVTLAA